MNAIEAQAKLQGSGAPLPLAPAGCCCPECCSAEESASTATPCC